MSASSDKRERKKILPRQKQKEEEESVCREGMIVENFRVYILPSYLLKSIVFMHFIIFIN